MKLQDIKKTIEMGFKAGWPIGIQGYVDSKGNIRNFQGRHLPPGGYQNLVQESLTQLDDVSLPPDADAGLHQLEDKARDELRASFKGTLEGTHVSRRGEDALENSGKGYWLDPSRPEVIILMGLEATADAEDVEVKPATRKSAPLTQAKDMLKKELPVSRYIAKLVLSEDKVGAVRVIPS